MTAKQHKRRWLFRLVALLLVFGVFELSSCVALHMLARRYAMDPMAEITPEAVESYLAPRYVPGLGWEPLTEDTNSIGARSKREYSNLENTISVYGDSYTFGDGVDVEHCWATQLEGRLGCGVLNFGVGGYGTDQALMRLEQKHKAVPSKTVLFCIQAENVLRNLTIHRGFYVGGAHPPKPRYILSGDGLSLLNPYPTTDAVRRLLIDDQPSFIELACKHDDLCQEMLVNGQPWSLRFPYTYQMAARFPFLSRRVKGKLNHLGRHAEHYQEGSAGLEVMKRIVVRFHQFADERGFKPFVVVFPAPRDIYRHINFDDVPYQNLLDFFESEQIAYYDFLGDFSASGNPKPLWSTEFITSANSVANWLPKSSKRLYDLTTPCPRSARRSNPTSTIDTLVDFLLESLSK